MSEERLIIQKRPQHYKHRLVAAVAVCGLAVVGVWGLQMKMTFGKYAAQRQEAQVDDALEQAHRQLDQSSSANTVQDGVDEIKGMIEAAVREQAAKNQAVEQVTDEMKTQLEAGATAETTPAPEVAGETTEAN